MRVVTWNLDFWQHRAYHNDAWAYLRNKIKPDLALLQEVSPPRLHKNEYVLLNVVQGRWGTALYTRDMALEKLTFRTYPERVVAAQWESSSAEKVVIVSVHAPIIKNRVFPYLDQIFDEIESLVGNQAFIVGGDLNTARLAEKVWSGYGHGPFFERLAKSIFLDCVQKFHSEEQQTIFRPGQRHPFQDDHLFVSHGLAEQVTSCEVLNNETTRSFSDHVPVLAEIGI